MTGITGYLGSAILKLLFKEQDRLGWMIRGTVRNPGDENKLKPLRDYFGDKLNDPTRFELHRVACEDLSTFENAFAGATYVIHTAAPVVIF